MDDVTMLPATLAARLLGFDVVELEALALAGMLPFDRRGWRSGGLVVAPRLRLPARMILPMR